MPDIAMPRLSDSMVEGTIVRWLKADGDRVRRGEELVEIETDKATIAYESDHAGVLAITLPAGATAAVGEPIATVDASADAAPPAAAGADPTAGHSAPAPDRPGPAATTARPPSPTPTAARPVDAGPMTTRPAGASPVARRFARALGVDVAAVAGTGPSGRVLKADVRAAAARTPATPSPSPSPASPKATPTAKGDVTVTEPTSLQQTVARRMAVSRATVPTFEVTLDVDMHAVLALRSELKTIASDGEPVPSVNDVVVKAVALALREHPRANGAYVDERFEHYSRVNVGIAVAAADALVVPTIFDADRLSLGQIARTTRDLADRVRDGRATPAELDGATFTVSNLGMYGVDGFTAIVNPPQAAILAVGGIAPRPAVVDGTVVPRPTMRLTLVSDHRILYGADAAQLIGAIGRRLHSPLLLSL